MRQLLSDGNTVLFCLLHSSLLSASEVEVHNLLDRVPGYCDNEVDVRQHIKSTIENASSGPLDFVIDSVDTLLSDIGSLSETHKFLQEVLLIIRGRSSPSRFILHVQATCPLLPLLSLPAFSPSLSLVIPHPTALLLHLATEYLTPPPPLSPEPKFWSIFLPMSERMEESERLVFGSAGEGAGDSEQFVIEVIARGDGDGLRRRGVDRTLHGWSMAKGLCSLEDIDALKPLWARSVPDPTVADPTQNVSFNLNLTEAQQNSRAQVPLPYAHEGKPSDKPATASAAIFYDPDSADDIDDDDPDEDLDI
ncbi:hypothetical protein FB45DRAFT_917257 [Roridomyces roridus]|uniref:Elongator complex protein 5 n=1 Tax=Roridomyces roridus TaxID=1738132 RepID=A0AAD7BUW0_9AGAR|nr:hypothetical protein FB45DRAFT_917257 [Roridomyces roridus]